MSSQSIASTPIHNQFGAAMCSDARPFTTGRQDIGALTFLHRRPRTDAVHAIATDQNLTRFTPSIPVGVPQAEQPRKPDREHCDVGALAPWLAEKADTIAALQSVKRVDPIGEIVGYPSITGTTTSAASRPFCPRDAVAFRPALVRFFRRKLRDGNDVEDLVQEVFVRVLARHGGVVENLCGYVFQIAASVLMDRHRRRTVRHAADQVPFDTEQHGGTDFDAGRVAETRETLQAVAAALMNLPERTRAIFVLRRLDGHNYKDIALKFEISVSAVEKHMARAMQHLLTSPGCVR